MTSFWLCAGLLLATALAFILVPQLRSRRGFQANRTRVNVELYRERLRMLEVQHEAGTLGTAQLEAGRIEAARELLDDTQVPQPANSARRRVLVPLITLLSMPPLALTLYLQWGALDKLTEARQQGSAAAPNIEKVTKHLESLLAARPDASEGWSLLGRAYVAQNRMAEAAQAFERAATIAGRPADVLGRWAEAQYYAGGRQWTSQLQALTDEALAAHPQEATSLRLLGTARFHVGRYVEAAASWERLLITLPERDPSRAVIANDIAQARQLAASGSLKGRAP